MTTEEEIWVQTRITVTPEDDATIREISKSAVLSSSPDVPLILEDKIVYRRSISRIQFPEAKELRALSMEFMRQESFHQFIPSQDAENQTYLQGTDVVHISAEYKDEATQTLYMSSPCPPLTYFMDILSDFPMPTLKNSTATNTIISFPPDASQNVVTEQLSANTAKEELEAFVSDLNDEEEASSEILDILHFSLARAFWIIDPASQKKVEAQTDQETQTSIKFNYHTNTLVNDSETQTELTCEPKKSNTMLLSDYWETKNIIGNYLEDCLTRGIENKIFVDEIINELIDKCIKRIKYPMKDQTMQTIVTYRARGEREEDILQKLKRGIVVDPMEASIVVIPLINDLLQTVTDTVSRNAPIVAKCIVQIVLRRTMAIIAKLMELEMETQPKPIDRRLAQRRKKILDSMLQKETETVYTQTTIGGVSEIQKVKEKEVVCSICRRPSVCEWCAEDIDADVPREETKILRTEDILLAYKPCYIVTTTSEKKKSLQMPYQPLRKIYPPVKPPVNISDHISQDSRETIDVFPEAEIMPQESINEWSYVLDATLMKPFPIRETTSTPSQTINSLDKVNTCVTSKIIPKETANALEILKNTFCSQETCITSAFKNLDDCLSSRRQTACIKSSCETCLNRSRSTSRIFALDTCSTEQTRKPPSKLHLPTSSIYKNGTSSQIYMKSDNCFKVIPVNLSQTSNTQKELK